MKIPAGTRRRSRFVDMIARALVILPLAAVTSIASHPRLDASASLAHVGNKTEIATSDAFTVIREYPDGGFVDVETDDWFYPYVRAVYERGFADGQRPGVFNPGGDLTVGEAIKLAVELHMRYYGKTLAFPPATPWYGAYTEAAIRWGITAPLVSYTVPATRALMAQLVYKALPADLFTEINDVADRAIPDVLPSEPCGSAVYALYRAGVLTGEPEYGRFKPDSPITRAQAVAVVARATVGSYRVGALRTGELTAGDIYNLRHMAVIRLDTYDEIDTHIRSASAFFVSPDGLAMTNYHVLEYGYRVVATLYDGSEAEASVEYVNEENDIAMLRVEGGGYDYLKISDAGAVKSGDVVFVISSPMGLYDTISEGIVSYPERELNGSMYIQFTAAISFGSGGAPLLDSRGFVIGIANSSFNDGQGLNLASAAKME